MNFISLFRKACGFFAVAVALAAFSSHGLAENFRQVEVQTGASGRPFTFFPDRLDFKVGEPVELVIANPGSFKHIFSSAALAAAVQTRSIEVLSIKDNTTVGKDLDLAALPIEPGTKVVWRFVPLLAGDVTDWHCSAPGHEETGMVGKIFIN